MKVQIICHDNQAGLSKDRMITRDALAAAGHEVHLTNNKAKEYTGQQYDINIFHEIIDAKYYKQARKNIFFPNPEWYFEGMFSSIIHGIDLVCAKTKDCANIFLKRKVPTVYTSFTSDDKLSPSTAIKKKQFLHTCGKSVHKGTNHIKMAWLNGVTAPLILVESSRDNPKPVKAVGLKHILGRISDVELKKYQNESWFHLFPSKYEGFGHAIWESMSCGGILLTVDGPPMNEFADKDTGIMMPFHRRKKHHYAVMLDTHHIYIKKAVETAMGLSEEELESKSKAARAKWEANDKFFKKTLVNTVNELG